MVQGTVSVTANAGTLVIAVMILTEPVQKVSYQ